MEDQEHSSQSSYLQEILRLPSTLRALYYSDDFQTRVCWWLVYTLVVLIIFIHLAWRLYGVEIAKTFMLQGGQYTPTRQSSQDGVSPGQHVKVD